MKRIFSILAALTLIAFVAAPAMAFDLSEGEFVIGLMGTNTEMGVDMSTALTVGVVTDLFDATDIGAVFSGDTDLSAIRIGGAAYTETLVGRIYDRMMWFAVEEGTTPVADLNGFTGIQSPLVNMQAITGGADDYYTATLSSNTMGGLLDTYYSGALENAVGRTDLSTLTASNSVVMDIWSYDNNASTSLDDDILVDTGLNLVIGIDANNMVYAQVVPIPGALILLGSGLLALVGVRRKNA